MRTQAFIQAQEGRFVVALSLQEAESLRGCLHMTGRTQGIVGDAPTTAALRLTDGTCLDGSRGYVRAESGDPLAVLQDAPLRAQFFFLLPAALQLLSRSEICELPLSMQLFVPFQTLLNAPTSYSVMR